MSNPDSIVHYSIEKWQKSIRTAIQQGQWVSAANNTKWSELVAAIQEYETWRPPYRFCWLTNRVISRWDRDWFYHLPYPFVDVLWLDLRTLEQTRHQGIIDHSARLTNLLVKIGLEFEQRQDVIRIWGYLPKDETDFPPQANFQPPHQIFSDTWK